MSEGNMNEMNESNRIINRHKARLLKNLEDAQCPRIFLDAVISGINWLRSDLNDYERTGGLNAGEEKNGNH
jgi:hypothetical protein